LSLHRQLAAKHLGAEQILTGRHKDRTELGGESGATDVIAGHGDEGNARLRELTGGDGTLAVLERVGSLPALKTAVSVVRHGGVVSLVGVPRYTDGPVRFDMVMRNVTLTGGAAPARAYIEELLPDVLDGTSQPGLVLDRTISLAQVPAGYDAMASRNALKVLHPTVIDRNTGTRVQHINTRSTTDDGRTDSGPDTDWRLRAEARPADRRGAVRRHLGTPGTVPA
jgi:threonine dehydrogenase-like Zn-dependent dehydrogenase